MSRKRKQWIGRIYLGQAEDGKQLYRWVGRFDTRRERDDAVAAERVKLRDKGAIGLPTCDQYVASYLAEYKRTNKGSSYDTMRQRLERFRKDFAGRSLDVSRGEAKDWVNGEGRWRANGPVPPSCVPAVVTLYNHAIDEDDLPLGRSPFRKLGKRTKGRSEDAPPTPDEFLALRDACSALGDYANEMRAMMDFSAFTLMRPSELYALEKPSIDFKRMRVRKSVRLYRGTIDEPKTGPKTIALTPPARDAILPLMARDGLLVFRSKTGKRLSQSGMSGYWQQVLARAQLDFDFYHATKHYGVWFMWTQLQMSERAIAGQAGWSLNTVHKMLAIYGHGDVGALDEVDRAFAMNVTPLRPSLSDASQMHRGAGGAS